MSVLMVSLVNKEMSPYCSRLVRNFMLSFPQSQLTLMKLISTCISWAVSSPKSFLY